jgi:hypothetical protein
MVIFAVLCLLALTIFFFLYAFAASYNDGFEEGAVYALLFIGVCLTVCDVVLLVFIIIYFVTLTPPIPVL